MKTYEVTIDIKKLLHYSVTSKLHIDNETLLMLIKNFSVYIRDVYKYRIHEAVHSRRYKGRWEPVEDLGYLEFLGVVPSESIESLMYDSLEIREIRNKIVIRFEPSYKYPGTKMTLLRVLNAIDNGTSKFNARPILKYMVRTLNNEIPHLWRIYLIKRGVLLR